MSRSELEEKYKAWLAWKDWFEMSPFSTRSERELLAKVFGKDKQVAAQAYIDWIHYNIGLALGGDRVAAGVILREFSLKAQKHQAIPQWLSWYVGKAVGQILDGVNAKEALGLSSGKKGRPKEHNFFRDMLLYDSVLRKRVKHEKSFEHAVADTSQECAVSESTVKRAYELIDRLLS